MPDVGTRLPPPVSHTSTHQWQSFEVRMRYRRAERCVLRAEAALDAGMEEDARAALAEARALNAATPDFDSLRAKVLERRAVAMAAARRARARRTLSVALASLAVLAVTVAMWPSSESGTPQPGIPAAAAATVPSPTRSAEPVSLSSNPVAPVAAPASNASTTAKMDAVAPTSGAISKPPDPLPVVNPVTVPPASESSLPDIAKAEPQLRLPPPIAETTAAIAPPSTNGADRFVTDLPTAVIPIPRTPPAPPPPAPAPAPDPRTIEEPHVRAVLAQFEAAYTNLSAQDARAVWPSVDERSLARAFDNLESQQVVLGQCSIDMSSASAAAAECAGTMSWTPKIGGGRRTESRRWRFDLAKANGVWRIERAVPR